MILPLDLEMDTSADNTSLLAVEERCKAQFIETVYFIYYGEVAQSVDPCGYSISVPMGKGLFVWKRERRFFEAWSSFNGKLNGRGR